MDNLIYVSFARKKENDGEGWRRTDLERERQMIKEFDASRGLSRARNRGFAPLNFHFSIKR